MLCDYLCQILQNKYNFLVSLSLMVAIIYTNQRIKCFSGGKKCLGNNSSQTKNETEIESRIGAVVHYIRLYIILFHRKKWFYSIEIALMSNSSVCGWNCHVIFHFLYFRSNSLHLILNVSKDKFSCTLSKTLSSD